MTRSKTVAAGFFSLMSLIAWTGLGMTAEQSSGGTPMGQKSGQGMSSQNPNDATEGRDSHLGPQGGGDEGSQGGMRSGRGTSKSKDSDPAAHSSMKPDRMGQQGEESGVAARSNPKSSQMQGDGGKGGHEGERGGSMGMGSGSGSSGGSSSGR